jgi:hypothetical protein
MTDASAAQMVKLTGYDMQPQYFDGNYNFKSVGRAI